MTKIKSWLDFAAKYYAMRRQMGMLILTTNNFMNYYHKLENDYPRCGRK